MKNSILNQNSRIARSTLTTSDDCDNINAHIEHTITFGNSEEHKMIITATELKSNIGKYLSLANAEDIFITKNGKKIAKLSSAKQDKVNTMKSLFGIIPDDGTTLDQTREERLKNYEVID